MPAGQSALSVPRHNFHQPSLAPACLSVVYSLLLFSLLSFFRAGFPGVVWTQGCAVATSAIRGVSRSGFAASPCGVQVLPDSRRLWHQEHRAPTQEPRIFSGVPSVRGAQVAVAVLVYWWDIYVLGLLFLAQPAVTSAI